MKKILSAIACAFFALAVSVNAAVDDITYTLAAAGTNQSSESYVARGNVEGVLITIPAAKTANVSVVTASGFTIFSKAAVTAATDGYIPLRYPMYSSAGAALTSLTTGDGSTNAAANAVIGQIGVAEVVTATVTPVNTATNSATYTVKLILNK